MDAAKEPAVTPAIPNPITIGANANPENTKPPNAAFFAYFLNLLNFYFHLFLI